MDLVSRVGLVRQCEMCKNLSFVISFLRMEGIFKERKHVHLGPSFSIRQPPKEKHLMSKNTRKKPLKIPEQTGLTHCDDAAETARLVTIWQRGVPPPMRRHGQPKPILDFAKQPSNSVCRYTDAIKQKKSKEVMAHNPYQNPPSDLIMVVRLQGFSAVVMWRLC